MVVVLAGQRRDNQEGDDVNDVSRIRDCSDVASRWPAPHGLELEGSVFVHADVSVSRHSLPYESVGATVYGRVCWCGVCDIHTHVCIIIIMHVCVGFYTNK